MKLIPKLDQNRNGLGLLLKAITALSLDVSGMDYNRIKAGKLEFDFPA